MYVIFKNMEHPKRMQFSFKRLVKSFLAAIFSLSVIACYSAEASFEEGEKAFQKRDPEKAIPIFNKIFHRKEWDELSFKSALRLGECYMAIGNKEEAKRFLNLAKKGEGDVRGEAIIGIGVIFLMSEKYDLAIDKFTQVINQYKSDGLLAYAYYNRGLAYKGKKWISRALSDLRTAKLKAKGNDELVKAIDYQIKECQSAYEKFAQQEANHLARIHALRERGDNESCASLLRELARLCEDWGDIDYAIYYEKQAISYSTSDEFRAGSWMDIGYRYEKLKDYEKAEEAFLRVINEYPKSSFAGEAVKEEAVCREHILKNMLNTKLREGYYNGDYDSAIKTLEKFLKDYEREMTEGIKFSVMWLIGRCYEHKFDFLNAIERYKLIINENPNNSNALLAMGRCYLQLGEYERALSSWEKANASRLILSYRQTIKPKPIFPKREQNISAKLIGPIDGPLYDFEMDEEEPLIIYGTQGKNASENEECKKAAYDINETREILFDRITGIAADVDVHPEELKQNILLISLSDSNKILQMIKDKLPFNIGTDYIEIGGRVYKGKDLGIDIIMPNPFNKEKFLEIYLAFEPNLLKSVSGVFRGYTDYVIFTSKSISGPSTSTAPQDLPVLEEGFFLKLSPYKWLPF